MRTFKICFVLLYPIVCLSIVLQMDIGLFEVCALNYYSVREINIILLLIDFMWMLLTKGGRIAGVDSLSRTR